MKGKHPLSEQLVAYILLISLFLQSCTHLNNTPQKDDSTIYIEQLAGKQLVSKEGHVVIVYHEAGQLQASVKEGHGSLSRTHHLPVYVEEGITIKELNKKENTYVHLPTSEQLGYVYVGSKGLKGGMQVGSEDEEEECKPVSKKHKLGEKLEGLDKVKEKEEHMKHPVDNDLADYQNLLDFAIIPENPFERCPEEITFMILERAAIDNYLSNGNTGSLGVVCQDWRRIMKQDQMKKSIDSIKDEYIYRRFLKGVLVYRPNEGSDIGRIDLPIASLVNPLEGTFDLSQCGDTGQCLSISTGYRKKKKAENEYKIEIWLTPRFLVEKEINGSAQHYQGIFPSQWPEKAPIGIFWTWSEWDNMGWYDYLTTNTMDELGNDNLCKKWWSGVGASHQYHSLSSDLWEPSKFFHVHFVN